jgi:hypothetical protein
MRRLIAIVAFVGFALSIVIHGATFPGAGCISASSVGSISCFQNK